MPAQSQQQQKLFGLALAFKRGEVPASEVSDEIKDIADRMSEKEIEDFASTKHKGLPKMKEQLRKIVREIMRERAISEIELSKDDMDKLHSDGEVEVDGEKVTYDESVTEGKKVFRVNPQIGKVKYSISSHDGVKKHKDGSDFFDIETFKNKVDLEKAIKNYTSKGFKMESVNEGIEPQIKKIAYFTGTRPEAVEDFVSKYALNFTKLLKYVQKGGLPQRMELVSALAGRPNNPKQKKIIKMFQESVNEGISVFDERHFGKKGIIIMIDDNGKKVSAIFKDKKNADKFNRNKPSDIKKLLDLAKKTKYPKAIDESVNEGPSTEEKRIAMLAVRKQAKYRNVNLEQAIQDQINALMDLQRDVKKGKKIK